MKKRKKGEPQRRDTNNNPSREANLSDLRQATVTSNTWKRFHATATTAWALLIIPTLIWWKNSILWIALMSVYANVSSHWSSYQASRAEEANKE